MTIIVLSLMICSWLGVLTALCASNKSESGFSLEVDPDGLGASVIGQGDIRIGDRLNFDDETYRVEDIEHYSEPADMWRASVAKVDAP